MLLEQLKQLNLAQPIAIIGAGVTGKSCFDLLQLAGITATVFDERNSLPAAFSDNADSVQLGTFTRDHFRGFATILLSPGVDTRRDCFVEVRDKIVTDIELFARLTTKPVIGVTASNGKSTVVTLVHEVTQLAGKNYALCGNIGLPVLQALMENEATCDGYIIELSSYHLERAPSLKPAIGVWLNVSPDHLDRYDSYEAYVATKAKLLAQSDSIVANKDDENIAKYLSHEDDNTVFFSHRYHVHWLFEKGQIHNAHGKPVFALADYPQIGTHHADNLMAVFAVAEKLGIDEKITASACKAFKPLASRAVVVGERDGVTFINDSKGTNIGATVAAISGIERPIILLAGGQGKGQDFNELAQVAAGRVKTAVLFGQDAEVIVAAMQDKVATAREENLDNAFAHAVKIANTGDMVMLSPACASFDQFESYLKRGERFECLAKEWINAQ